MVAKWIVSLGEAEDKTSIFKMYSISFLKQKITGIFERNVSIFNTPPPLSNGPTGSDLQHLTDDRLEALAVTDVGHRRVILRVRLCPLLLLQTMIP